MKPHRADIQAALNLEIAHNINARITTTLNNLDLAQPGYPTQTIGASPPQPAPLQDCRNPDCGITRPCLTHDGEPVELTTVERYALQPNPARRDLETLAVTLHKIYHLLVIADNITSRWGHTPTKPIDNIWCDNCTAYGRHEPCPQGTKQCRFCADFAREYKRPCPKAIWDARDARGGRIDKGTIQRLLKKPDVNA